jgi:exodeoxyribonuclease VII small subunit
VAKRKSPDNPQVSDNPDAPSLEQSLARLEEIAAQLEDGRLGLSESLACYEEGVKHLKRCYELLEHAERRIELLAGIDAEGKALTRPFDDAAVALEERAPSRANRRPEPEQTPVEDAAEVAAGDVDDEGLLF